MIENVLQAYYRSKDIANHTPIFTSTTANKMIDGELFFKCENFQKIGAFKFRGAYNAVSLLSREEKAKGVITHSSGNHAQALSLASKIAGVKATIVMPENAPKVKVEATRGYGAKIVKCGSHPNDREETTKRLIEKHNYTLIHPSDNLNVIYGQGTAALELFNTIPHLDYLLTPVGGGGLLSGSAITSKHISPSTKVIGVEPFNADDAYHSFKTGEIHPSVNPNTIADGLRTSLGPNTFNIITKYVDDIIRVTEEEIIQAMQFLWERMKIVVEPSGAVPFAGVLSSKLKLQNKRVGIILSGGNIDLTRFFEILKDTIER